jgi:hypothetical protein
MSFLSPTVFERVPSFHDFWVVPAKMKPTDFYFQKVFGTTNHQAAELMINRSTLFLPAPIVNLHFQVVDFNSIVQKFNSVIIMLRIISFNQFETKHAALLFRALARNETLKILVLVNTWIDDPKSLIKLMRRNRTLKLIDLSYHRMRPGHVSKIWTVFRLQNTTLEYLDLSPAICLERQSPMLKKFLCFFS